MTRDDDTYIKLYDRSTLANELGAHALVSIHVNAHYQASMEGVQVFYSSIDDRDNKTFAAIMKDSLVKELNASDKGIVEGSKLVVLKETKMPAISLSLGFLTNDKEGKLLKQDDYRKSCAEAICKGIIQHFNSILVK